MTADENRIAHVIDEAADLEEQIMEDEAYIRVKYADIELKKKRLEHLTELYYQLINEREE